MIHLFRRIRQQYFRRNKLNKYLLYAVGEIILVVIGILITLQINNQSEGVPIFLQNIPLPLSMVNMEIRWS